MSPKACDVNIPRDFFETRYNSSCYPGMPNWAGLKDGANCQQFAYEILRHNGLYLPNFRSKELWEDTTYTEVVSEFSPFDLLLFHRSPDPWGAHVAVCVGNGEALHLARKIGIPVIWRLQEFTKLPEYSCLIGGKRIKP